LSRNDRPCPTGKSLRFIGIDFALCQALPVKIFFFRFSENYDLVSPSRLEHEGRFGQSSRNARRVAVDALARETKRADADGEGVWS
jgi:hypothetical protein